MSWGKKLFKPLILWIFLGGKFHVLQNYTLVAHPTKMVFLAGNQPAMHNIQVTGRQCTSVIGMRFYYSGLHCRELSVIVQGANASSRAGREVFKIVYHKRPYNEQ